MRAAAAQVAGQRLLAPRRACGSGLRASSAAARHHHAGDAVAALRRLLGDERRLHADAACPACQGPRSSRTLLARRPSTRHRACADGSPSTSTVHAPHWPRPQPNFAPVRTQRVAQHVQQGFVGVADVDRPVFTVDVQRESRHGTFRVRAKERKSSSRPFALSSRCALHGSRPPRACVSDACSRIRSADRADVRGCDPHAWPRSSSRRRRAARPRPSCVAPRPARRRCSRRSGTIASPIRTRTPATACRNFSAIRIASSSVQFSSSTANSSPPTRASVSRSRSTAASEPVTPRSSASPAACPPESLTSLKSSRSMYSTACRRSRSAALASACASRCSNSRRFTSPVKRVVPRLVDQLRRVSALPRDVLQHEHGTGNASRAVMNRRDRNVDGHLLAIRPHEQRIAGERFRRTRVGKSASGFSAVSGLDSRTIRSTASSGMPSPIPRARSSAPRRPGSDRGHSLARRS